MASFALAPRTMFGRPSIGQTAVVRRSGPSPALARTQKALEAARAATRRARENASGKGASIEAAVATVAGGASAGAVRAYMPEIAGFDSTLVLGAGLTAAGIFGVKGKIGGYLVNAGSGMLAVGVAELVEDMLGGSGS